MSSTLLYLLRTHATDLLIQDAHPTDDTTVVLLHDAVTLKDVPATRVFALAEDAAERGIAPSAPAISYKELVDLVFQADRVVVL